MTEIQIIKRVRQVTSFCRKRPNNKKGELYWYDYKTVMKTIENLLIQDIEKGKNTISEAEELLSFAESLIDELQ